MFKARKMTVISLVLLLVAATTWVCLDMTQNARAGIGPAGFAYYARQGILHGINLAYGKGNSPYNVTCTEKPNYYAQLGQITDTVKCTIRLKP